MNQFLNMLQSLTLKFLSDLKKNNNKLWFEEHRGEYMSAKKDFEHFISQLIKKAAAFDSDIKELQVKDCTFRLNRDIRFSKDKTPYKINMGASLNRGGQTSITHMHFDIDLSHILHTQFLGRKRVLLFPYEEQCKLYRKPFEVLSLADFSNYYKNNGIPDYSLFPALKFANGYEVTLEHGDTLFMPTGYWHHMEYLDSGFALSLRAIQNSSWGKLKGAWNLFGMRSIDTLMKRSFPKIWYVYKTQKIEKAANEELKKYGKMKN